MINFVDATRQHVGDITKLVIIEKDQTLATAAKDKEMKVKFFVKFDSSGIHQKNGEKKELSNQRKPRNLRRRKKMTQMDPQMKKVSNQSTLLIIHLLKMKRKRKRRKIRRRKTRRKRIRKKRIRRKKIRRRRKILMMKKKLSQKLKKK